MARRKSSTGRVFNYPSSLPKLDDGGKVYNAGDDTPGDGTTKLVRKEASVANSSTTWNKNITDVVNNHANYSPDELIKAIRILVDYHPDSDKIITKEGVSSSESGVYYEEVPSTGLPENPTGLPEFSTVLPEFKDGGEMLPKYQDNNNPFIVINKEDVGISNRNPKGMKSLQDFSKEMNSLDSISKPISNIDGYKKPEHQKNWGRHWKSTSGTSAPKDGGYYYVTPNKDVITPEEYQIMNKPLRNNMVFQDGGQLSKAKIMKDPATGLPKLKKINKTHITPYNSTY